MGKYFRKPKYSSTQTKHSIKKETIPLIEIITETSTTDHEKTDSVKNNLLTIKKRKYIENGEKTKKNKVDELWRENLKEEPQLSSKKSSKKSFNSKAIPESQLKIEFPAILGIKRRRNGKLKIQSPSNKNLIFDSSIPNNENIFKNFEQESKRPIKNNINFMIINENDKISDKHKTSIKKNYIVNLDELEKNKKTMQFKDFNDEFAPTQIVLYKPMKPEERKYKSTAISNKIIEIDKVITHEYQLPKGEEFVQIETVENFQKMSQIETEEQFAQIKNNILDYLKMLDGEGKRKEPEKNENLKMNKNGSYSEEIQEFSDEFQFNNLYNFMFS